MISPPTVCMYAVSKYAFDTSTNFVISTNLINYHHLHSINDKVAFGFFWNFLLVIHSSQVWLRLPPSFLALTLANQP
jgi:hypothetical protein